MNLKINTSNYPKIYKILRNVYNYIGYFRWNNWKNYEYKESKEIFLGFDIPENLQGEIMRVYMDLIIIN